VIQAYQNFADAEGLTGQELFYARFVEAHTHTAAARTHALLLHTDLHGLPALDAFGLAR
jgi:hypothetical protein